MKPTTEEFLKQKNLNNFYIDMHMFDDPCGEIQGDLTLEEILMEYDDAVKRHYREEGYVAAFTNLSGFRDVAVKQFNEKYDEKFDILTAKQIAEARKVYKKNAPYIHDSLEGVRFEQPPDTFELKNDPTKWNMENWLWFTKRILK